jgi:putative DNA primase/helicase
MVDIVVRDAEKQRRDAQKAQRDTEDRAEKQRDRAEQREQREQKQRDDAAEKAAKKAEKREREKLDAFASIVELPSAMHEARLAELANRLGEDPDVLEAEFAVFADSADRRRGDAVAMWPEPVNTKELLAAVEAQFCRYVVVRVEEALAVTLWSMFAWVHDVARHSPILTFRAPVANSGKTLSCTVVGFLTPRAHAGGELTGASLFRFVDRVRPTLIIDDADKLFKRKPDLAHVVNLSWTRGYKIPRVVQGTTVWFDPFCPKIIAGKRLVLLDTTETRTINIKLRRKLRSEKVEHFSYEDDETFYTLRCKLARWAADNKKALKTAHPVLPDGFDNRLADNWRIMLAIADLAGGTYPKAARKAAVKLSHVPEPDEGIRLLEAFCEVFVTQATITSQAMMERLGADPTGEWCNFRGRGPITQRQIAAILRDFDIHTVVLHPPRKAGPAAKGYRREQFADAFERNLSPDAFERYLSLEKTKKE